MKDNSTSPVRRNDGFQRYLKPGALAQIRNSRINTGRSSSRSLSHPLDPPPSTSQNSADEARNLTVDQVPHLLRKIYGPYSFQRKKLAAARSLPSMMMVNLNAPVNSVIESTGGNSTDVIAH
ncbi:unnamed protein product [Microthlaspi erraticum]|uniref:Uncharacterized protein n=1 Tax=Microthlaspi erraticum TaxID=1685480 RepID=A0A6D2HFJ3_9BRAS|nr:unnamed protein product [Microthlaspi erraticum]